MAILKKTKQLFAALLCLCMVAAILPAGVPAAKAAEAKTIDLSRSGVTAPNKSDISALTAANTNGQWAYHSQSDDGRQNKVWNTTYGLSFNYFYKGRWAAFTLYDLEAGVYDVTMDHIKSISGGVSEFYLLPYSATVDIKDCNLATLIGEVDFFISEGEPDIPGDKVGTAIAPSDGDYILVIKSNGMSPKNEGYTDYGHYAVWGTKIAMTPAADGVYAKLEADSVVEGKSMDIAIGVMESGELVGGYNVSFTDPSVASYASGKITGLKPGSTDATVSYGSYESVTLPFTVTEIHRDRVISTEGLNLNPQWVYLNTYTTPDMTNGDWVYHSSKTTYNGVDENWPLSNFNDTIDFRMTAQKADRYIAFEYIDVLPGDYKVELVFPAYNGGGVMDFYLVPDCTTVNLDLMCTPSTYLGRINFYADHILNAAVDYELLETEYLKDITITEQGNYVLIARGVNDRSIGGNNFGAVTKEIRLDWQGAPSEAAAPGDAAFSKTYAYVRENVKKGNKSYDVTLVGGISADDLADYNGVGFEVASDYYENTLVDTAVFEKLTLSDGGELTNTMFGSDYLFVQNFTVYVDEIDEAFDFMTIKAVAETAEGGTIYGDEYTIQIGK